MLITTAAAQSCPANQIASDAQMIICADDVVPESAVPPLAGVARDPAQFDTNLTFFREV